MAASLRYPCKSNVGYDDSATFDKDDDDVAVVVAASADDGGGRRRLECFIGGRGSKAGNDCVCAGVNQIRSTVVVFEKINVCVRHTKLHKRMHVIPKNSLAMVLCLVSLGLSWVVVVVATAAAAHLLVMNDNEQINKLPVSVNVFRFVKGVGKKRSVLHRSNSNINNNDGGFLTVSQPVSDVLWY